MDIIKAYTFIPNEKNWITKLLIGAVVVFFSFLFIPMFFLVGYSIAVARNVKDGREDLMPDWNEDLGQKFIEGGILFVAMFIYALPLVLLVVCMALLILPAALAADTFDVGAVAGGAMAGSIALLCIALLYALFLAIILPAVAIQFVDTEEIGPTFNFREVFGIARDNFVDIVLLVLSYIVATFVFGLLAIIPICGWIAVAYIVPVWLQISVGHLLGQISAKMDGKKADLAYAA